MFIGIWLVVIKTNVKYIKKHTWNIKIIVQLYEIKMKATFKSAGTIPFHFVGWLSDHFRVEDQYFIFNNQI